jgi:glycosyltransferase involved in cell wall biosynthesis
VAYLNTRYPALSHTFIQREVESLRELGVEVVTFSIRRPSVEELGKGANPKEIASTVYLLRGAAVALGVLRALVLSPLRSLRLLSASQRLSPSGLGARLRHLAYAAEAVRLAQEMRRRGLTHVHVHMANNGAMVALLATRFDARLGYSLTVHGPAEFYDVFNLRLREKAENAAFVRCISDFCRAQVMTWTDPAVWDRLHVVHCGISVDDFAWSVRQQDGTLRVLSIGRLAPVKAHPILFEALRGLAERGVPWTLRIAGSGPEKGRLEELAKRLGISHRVEFLGPVAASRMPEELRRAGILVLPSFMEGVPVVLMEAMASGVPVLTTRVGGIAELVEDRVTGRVVHAGSAEAITAALTEMWGDPRATASRAEAARDHVCREFDARATGGRMRSLFERYAAAPTAPSTLRDGPPGVA